MNKKKPRRKDNPTKTKKPSSLPVESPQNKNLVWIVSNIDDNSSWGWHTISCPDFLRKIWKKMRNFETMTWVDILGANHHVIPISNIISTAQKRLEELGYDDKETLVSFHITGKPYNR